MTGVRVTQDVALDRKEWRRRTRPTARRQGKGHQGELGEQWVRESRMTEAALRYVGHVVTDGRGMENDAVIGGMRSWE